MNHFDDVWMRIFEPQPRLDDTGDAWEVQFEIPGVKKEDVKISVDSNRMTVRTCRKLKTGEDARKGSFAVPPNIDPERAEALVENGLLTIRLPKTKEASPRLIPIR